MGVSEPQRYTTITLSKFWWDMAAIPVKEDGRVVLLILTGVDVTQRVLAEEALRESDTRLHQTLEATGVGTFVWDVRAGILTWDAALCGIWGGDQAQAPGSHEEFMELVHPDDRERVAAASRQHVESGSFDELEHRLLRLDGDVRHVLSKAMPMRDTRGDLVGFRGLTFDITERKRLDEHLRHAQKMEAIGQLTAGIAHNFNNLLSVILPNVSLCLDRADAQSRERLLDVEHAASRAAELVRQLMLFARPDGRARKTVLGAAELCRHTADICRKTFPAAISIRLDACDPALRIRGEFVQLEQALLNICLNARDAMLEANSPSPCISIRLDRVDDLARIVVEDNGPGMEDAIAARVFEPFFTTKGAGRGTGLGLASAYAVVQDHAGVIACEGRRGQGARFELRLPLCFDRVSNAPPPHTPMPTHVGRGTILLVDDEALVRRALRGILERAGYVVLEAGSGEEGLQLIERHEARIDALLLDQSMPGLRGSQVVDALRGRGSALPVILVSGEPLAPDPRVSSVLNKPMRSTELLQAVARALADRVNVGEV